MFSRWVSVLILRGIYRRNGVTDWLTNSTKQPLFTELHLAYRLAGPVLRQSM